MESLKGGVSFKVNFINSGDNPGNSSGESQRLIGIYNGDWSLGRNSAVGSSVIVKVLRCCRSSGG